MGDSPTRHRAAVAALMAVICFPALARAQGAPAKREPGARGAPGVIVQFEESASTGVIYLQESGGMASAPSGPVIPARPVSARLPAPASVPAAAPASARPAGAARKLAQRQVMPPDGEAGKP